MSERSTSARRVPFLERVGLAVLVALLASPFAFQALFSAEQEGESRRLEEQRIGVMVLEITAALEPPYTDASVDKIAGYGTLTKHYVMIRGWLSEELRGVESQIDATRDPALRSKFQQKADFLRRAIRRIDLE